LRWQYAAVANEWVGNIVRPTKPVEDLHYASSKKHAPLISLENQLKPGDVPTTLQAEAGEQTFVKGPCSMCQTVRGSGAAGAGAPDLTHIGSRRTIASAVYPNNNAYLEAWITNAQSLKPGCKMPSLPQFSGVQLNELVAYLRQLK
jgi:cytochrome c oxidase subunit 2